MTQNKGAEIVETACKTLSDLILAAKRLTQSSGAGAAWLIIDSMARYIEEIREKLESFTVESKEALKEPTSAVSALLENIDFAVINAILKQGDAGALKKDIYLHVGRAKAGIIVDTLKKLVSFNIVTVENGAPPSVYGARFWVNKEAFEKAQATVCYLPRKKTWEC